MNTDMLPKRIDRDLFVCRKKQAGMERSVWISVYVLLLGFLGEVLFGGKASRLFYLRFVLDKLLMTKSPCHCVIFVFVFIH